MPKKKVVYHEFKTIEDIINTVHIGNKDNFLVDFKAWLEIVLNTVQTTKLSIELGGTEEQKEEYSKVSNSSLVGCSSMKWIDDGKHNLSIKVIIK